jgi:hypothetical protein
MSTIQPHSWCHIGDDNLTRVMLRSVNSVLNVFWTMGPHIERIVDVSILPPSVDLANLSKKEVKYL